MNKEKVGWFTLIGLGALILSVLVATAAPQLLSGRVDRYEVTFSQIPTCGNDRLYALPWAVRIANQTIQNGGSTLPANDSRALGALPDSLVANETRIVFRLADGNYRYTLMPAGDFWDPVTFPQGNFSGVVDVSGQNVMVNVTVANPGGNC